MNAAISRPEPNPRSFRNGVMLLACMRAIAHTGQRSTRLRRRWREASSKAAVGTTPEVSPEPPGPAQNRHAGALVNRDGGPSIATPQRESAWNVDAWQTCTMRTTGAHLAIEPRLVRTAEDPGTPWLEAPDGERWNDARPQHDRRPRRAMPVDPQTAVGTVILSRPEASDDNGFTAFLRSVRDHERARPGAYPPQPPLPLAWYPMAPRPSWTWREPRPRADGGLEEARPRSHKRARLDGGHTVAMPNALRGKDGRFARNVTDGRDRHASPIERRASAAGSQTSGDGDGEDREDQFLDVGFVPLSEAARRELVELRGFIESRYPQWWRLPRSTEHRASNGPLEAWSEAVDERYRRGRGRPRRAHAGAVVRVTDLQRAVWDDATAIVTRRFGRSAEAGIARVAETIVSRDAYRKTLAARTERAETAAAVHAGDTYRALAKEARRWVAVDAKTQAAAVLMEAWDNEHAPSLAGIHGTSLSPKQWGALMLATTAWWPPSCADDGAVDVDAVDRVVRLAAEAVSKARARAHEPTYLEDAGDSGA